MIDPDVIIALPGLDRAADLAQRHLPQQCDGLLPSIQRQPLKFRN